MNNQYFKDGDKFDVAKRCIVRTAENGTTTYIPLNPSLVGWSLVPGVGIKTPETVNGTFLLLPSGRIIQSIGNETIVYSDTNPAGDKLEFDDNGVAVIDAELGSDIVITKDGDIAKVDSVNGKSLLVEQEEITEESHKDDSILPFINESDINRKKEDIDLFDINASYVVDYEIMDNSSGDSDSGSSSSASTTVMIEDSDHYMFSSGDYALTRTPEGKYLLTFKANKDIEEYLEKNGGKAGLTALGDGSYQAEIDSCVYTHSGLYIKGLDGALRLDLNGGASALALDGVSSFSKANNSEKPELRFSAEFLKRAYTGADPALSVGAFGADRKGASGIDPTIKNDFKDSPRSIYNILALLSLGTEKDGVRYYGEEDSNFRIMATLVGDNPVIVVKIGDKNYLYNDKKFCELSQQRCATTETDNAVLSKLFMVDGRGKTPGTQEVWIPGEKAKDEQRIIALYDFLGPEIGGATKFEGEKRVLDYTATSEDSKVDTLIGDKNKIISSSQRNQFRVRTNLQIPSTKREKLHANPTIKTEEKTIPTATPTTTPTTTTDNPPPKKDDKKKKSMFWGTLSNSFLFAALFSGIACMFGLGVVALPMVIAFAGAGFVTKGIAYQGGFGYNPEFDKANGTEKNNEGTNEKTKNKKLSRKQNKYKSRSKIIDEYNKNLDKIARDIAELDAKDALSRRAGTMDSAEARERAKKRKELLARRKELEGKTAKLNTKNNKLLEGMSPIEIIELMGDRPSDKDAADGKIREGFDKDDLLTDLAVSMLSEPLPYKHRDGKLSFDVAVGNKTALAELTGPERDLLDEEISSIVETFGPEKDAFYIRAFIQGEALTRKRESGQPLTELEKATLNRLDKTINDTRAALGDHLFAEWEESIRAKRREWGIAIYDKSGGAISNFETLQEVLEAHKTLETLGKKESLTEEEVAIKSAASEKVALLREGIEARLSKNEDGTTRVVSEEEIENAYKTFITEDSSLDKFESKLASPVKDRADTIQKEIDVRRHADYISDEMNKTYADRVFGELAAENKAEYTSLEMAEDELEQEKIDEAKKITDRIGDYEARKAKADKAAERANEDLIDEDRTLIEAEIQTKKDAIGYDSMTPEQQAKYDKQFESLRKNAPETRSEEHRTMETNDVLEGRKVKKPKSAKETEPVKETDAPPVEAFKPADEKVVTEPEEKRGLSALLGKILGKEKTTTVTVPEAKAEAEETAEPVDKTSDKPLPSFVEDIAKEEETKKKPRRSFADIFKGILDGASDRKKATASANEKLENILDGINTGEKEVEEIVEETIEEIVEDVKPGAEDYDNSGNSNSEYDPSTADHSVDEVFTFDDLTFDDPNPGVASPEADKPRVEIRKNGSIHVESAFGEEEIPLYEDGKPVFDTSYVDASKKDKKNNKSKSSDGRTTERK